MEVSELTIACLRGRVVLEGAELEKDCVRGRVALGRLEVGRTARGKVLWCVFEVRIGGPRGRVVLGSNELWGKTV